MRMKHRRAALAVAATALAAGVGLSTATASVHGTKALTIVIWTDANRAPAVTKVADDWAAKNGATVKVISKDFGSIRQAVGTVAAADAPDVVLAASDWTGELAANGLVQPLYPASSVKAQFPKYTLDAFSYGTAVKKLYGIPVQVENIGLLVNTKLVKVPKTFKQLESEALALKKKNRLAFGICVQQGSGGDAYHMYPFFSGLGGYIFGTNSAGNLDPSNIGVANPTFLKNAHLIDKWNKEGLVNSAVDFSTASNAFLKKQAAFWITGPWESQALEQSGLKFKVIQMPAIAKPSVPFLGVQGFLVTKYASVHGVDALAQDFVANYVSTPAAQLALAVANGRYPANTVAGKSVKDPILAEFGKAGTGGVPMPNIPQMNSVWSDLGAAWVKATKGAGATPAATAFKAAARSIA